MNISIVLRNQRVKSKLTQGQVAIRIGISQKAYAKYEEAKSTPAVLTLKKLSTLYGYRTIEEWIDLGAAVG
jgi:transcriptional regulator with XRE-family HTH domain